jgi:hypothetical protein
MLGSGHNPEADRRGAMQSRIDRRSESGHAWRHTTDGTRDGGRCPLSRFRERLHGKVAFVTFGVPARSRCAGKIAGRNDQHRAGSQILIPDAVGLGHRFECRNLGGDRVVPLAIDLWMRFATPRIQPARTSSLRS